LFLWQVNQKDDPNTDSQHHALEPEYGGGGRSLRSIGTGGGGECFLSDQGILFVVRSVVVVSSDSISFFWYACEFQDS
jgi:hypothetical protein